MIRTTQRTLTLPLLLAFLLAAIMTTTPQEAAAKRTQHYTATNGKIYDPQGKPFIPIGANVGIKGAFEGSGIATGKAQQAQEWGWNMVRLTVNATADVGWGRLTQVGYEQYLAEIDAFIKEYNAAGIIVMIEAHDLHVAKDGPLGVNSSVYPKINKFWKDIATKYKNNPKVWFNPHNEAPVQNSDWYDVYAKSAQVIRGTGARNPIVVDSQCWGSDVGPIHWCPASGYSYDDNMAPRLKRNYGNIILSTHNYGASAVYDTSAKYSAYVDKVRATGLPLITGEAGWPVGCRNMNEDSCTDHRKAAYASADAYGDKGVGFLWWHATHDDFSLKSNNGAFYDGGAGFGLSEGGRLLWGLTH